MWTRRLAWLLSFGLPPGCDRSPPPAGRVAGSTAPAEASSGSTSTTAGVASSSAGEAPPSGASRATLVLLAGGDVSYGRMRGERLLREPARDDLAPLAPLLDAADLRFVNLEGPLSRYPLQGPAKMIFSAPPEAAEALVRAGIDVVSLANNHSWDYGEDGLMQTLANLERVRVAYVGAGRTRAEAYAPRVVERGGWRIAFVAVTDVWNQPFEPHPGKELIASAVESELVAAIARARASPGVDRVVVSYHGGYEYVAEPHQGTRALVRAALRAGADVFIGHHPHVLQAAAFVGGKPVLYSLGNLLMRMVTGKPWTEMGMLARLELRRDGPTTLSICPYRIFGLDPVPLGRDPERRGIESYFRFRFEQLLRANASVEPDAAARLGPFDAQGCAPLSPGAPGPPRGPDAPRAPAPREP